MLKDTINVICLPPPEAVAAVRLYFFPTFLQRFFQDVFYYYAATITAVRFSFTATFSASSKGVGFY